MYKATLTAEEKSQLTITVLKKRLALSELERYKEVVKQALKDEQDYCSLLVMKYGLTGRGIHTDAEGDLIAPEMDQPEAQAETRPEPEPTQPPVLSKAARTNGPAGLATVSPDVTDPSPRRRARARR